MNGLLSEIILGFQMQKIRFSQTVSKISKQEQYQSIDTFYHNDQPLREILTEHDLWVTSDKQSGSQAILSHAHLQGVDLQDVNLGGG